MERKIYIFFFFINGKHNIVSLPEFCLVMLSVWTCGPFSCVMAERLETHGLRVVFFVLWGQLLYMVKGSIIVHGKR